MPALTETYVAGSGQGLTWGAAFGTEVQSLTASNTAVQSSIVIDNSVVLDMYADLSLVFTSTATYGSGAYCWFFLYPLNQDGTTYGDNRYATAASGLPVPFRQYFSGSIAFTQGTVTQTGIVTGILLPPSKFKFVILNPSTAVNPTFPASGTNIYYRTYNRKVQ